MAMRERKRVGEVVNALEAFSQDIPDSTLQAKVTQLRDRALSVERSPIVTSIALQRVQSDLCSFCQVNHLLECSKVDAYSGCDFVNFAYVDSRPAPQ